MKQPRRLHWLRTSSAVALLLVSGIGAFQVIASTPRVLRLEGSELQAARGAAQGFFKCVNQNAGSDCTAQLEPFLPIQCEALGGLCYKCVTSATINRCGGGFVTCPTPEDPPAVSCGNMMEGQCIEITVGGQVSLSCFGTTFVGVCTSIVHQCRVS